MSGGLTWLARVLGRSRKRYSVPEGLCVYAVGDVHGRSDLLRQLLKQISAHGSTLQCDKSLIMLGDYVDRGPDSKGVISELLSLSLPGWEIDFLRGNHDQSVLQFIQDPAFYRLWRGFGGQQTLLSYGVSPPLFDDLSAFESARDEFVEKLPDEHRLFFERLQYSVVKGDYIFVHAGLRPGLDIDEQTPDDMMWIREDFLLSKYAFSKMVVHGHTPTEKPERHINRIGVDTGAHATGRLTAAILQGETCEFVTTDN